MQPLALAQVQVLQRVLGAGGVSTLGATAATAAIGAATTAAFSGSTKNLCKMHPMIQPRIYAIAISNSDWIITLS